MVKVSICRLGDKIGGCGGLGLFNVSGLCVVALSRNLKLTTTLDRTITQNPCYVPFLFRNYDNSSK
tara:strand:+ start:202 stop:399 length:198 start_codon:yes stop_codon:yes gene_type:complete